MSRSYANARTAFKKVTHVIFDMDGLLLDTERLYTEATTNIVSKYGKTYDWETKCQLMGMLGPEVAKRIVELLELPITWEEYYEMAQEQYNLLMPGAQLMPGAEKFVKHLHKNSIPIAVATSSSENSFNLKTQNHKEFFNMFHHTVTGGSDSEVKAGKPSPDIFLVCASRFPDKPNPANCLVLEDAPNGVSAAVAAHMQCVMVPDSQTDTMLCKLATLVIPSLEELKPEEFGLPPY